MPPPSFVPGNTNTNTGPAYGRGRGGFRGPRGPVAQGGGLGTPAAPTTSTPMPSSIPVGGYGTGRGGTRGPATQGPAYGAGMWADAIRSFQEPQFTAQEDLLNRDYRNYRADLQREYGHLGRDYNLDAQMLGLDRADLARQRALAGGQIADANALEALARRSLGITNRGFDVDESRATRTRRMDLFNNDVAAVAGGGGAFFGSGRRLRDESIRGTFDDTLTDIGLGREGAQTDFERAQVGFGATRRDAASRQQALDIQGQRYGLSETQMRNAVYDAAEQMGIDAARAWEQLQDDLASTDAERAAQAGQAFDVAMQLQQVIPYSPQMHSQLFPTPPQQPQGRTNTGRGPGYN